jgi:hypothetical protein
MSLGFSIGFGLRERPSLDYPYPAPAGYRWQIETYNGETVTYNGQACYFLERIV